MAAHAARAQPATLDPERDFVRLQAPARRRFLARARRAGQHAFHDLDQAADDAYQEAWLEVARRPDAAPIEGDPAGYLAGIMWHRFYQRELRRAQPRLVELSEGDDAHTVETPEEAALRAEAARAVQLALSSLPERERRALVLRALGLPHRDVAASLGVSTLRARKLADAGRRAVGVRVAAGEQGEPCASTASCLSAIVAGWHISPHRRARLDAHLDACPACRGTLVTLRREGALATGPLVIAAPGWWQQVLAGVLKRGEIASGGGAVGGGAALVGKLAAGCATVCLIGGGVAVVAEQTGGHRQDPARTTARAPVGSPSSATTAGGESAEVAAERRMKVAAAEQRARAAAQDTARRAQAKATRAAGQAARAARKARQAASAATAAAAKANAAAAVGRQAAASGQQAAASGQQAAASGQQAAQAGAAAGQQAAQKVQRALAGALGGYGG